MVVTGVGIVAGTLIGGWETFSAYLDALPESAGHDAGRAEVSPAALDALLDANEQRRLTRVCQLTVAATRLALADAAVAPGGELGLVVGTEFGDLRSTMEFADGYLDRGPIGLSPLLFPNTVMNTMAAAASIAVSARAASLTLNAPAIAGQLAVARAARMVASGRVARMIAGGVDETERLRRETLRQLGIVDDVTNEGATLLVLESRATARARGARVLAEIRGAAWGAVRARPHGVGRGVTSGTIGAAARSADIAPGALGWIYTSVSRDADRARWERAVLDRAFDGAPPTLCDVEAVIGHGAGAGAMAVAAALWTARTGRLPRLEPRPGESVAGFPGLAHGLARGGTQVAVVVGEAT